MTRLAWLTDVHWNFLSEERLRSFCEKIEETGCDAVVITGDIAEAPNVERLLTLVADHLQRSIYFVLGNHDYYRGSIAEVRDAMHKLTDRHPHLFWLPAVGVVPLDGDAVLVGHGGWGDARLGDYDNSTVMLNDYVLIDELAGLDAATRKKRLYALGVEAAAALHVAVSACVDHAAHVLVATHVPPFRESCWHEGQISDDNWLPHFTCGAVGEALREVMLAHPDCSMHVLCGHTHSAGHTRILANLEVATGSALYGAPEIQCVIDSRAITLPAPPARA